MSKTRGKITNLAYVSASKHSSVMIESIMVVWGGKLSIFLKTVVDLLALPIINLEGKVEAKTLEKLLYDAETKFINEMKEIAKYEIKKLSFFSSERQDEFNQVSLALIDKLHNVGSESMLLLAYGARQKTLNPVYIKFVVNKFYNKVIQVLRLDSEPVIDMAISRISINLEKAILAEVNKFPELPDSIKNDPEVVVKLFAKVITLGITNSVGTVLDKKALLYLVQLASLAAASNNDAKETEGVKVIAASSNYAEEDTDSNNVDAALISYEIELAGEQHQVDYS